MARICTAIGAGQNASSTTASTSRSLVSNARKIVPSATPAASAISRVVGIVPRSRMSRSAARTIDTRRWVGGRAVARGVTSGSLDE
jgi:hypothetical protein